MDCINMKCTYRNTGSCILGIAKDHGECHPEYKIPTITDKELEEKGKLKLYAHCKNCDYKTDIMPFKDLVFKISMEGGYIQNSDDDLLLTECPCCHEDTLIIE